MLEDLRGVHYTKTEAARQHNNFLFRTATSRLERQALSEGSVALPSFWLAADLSISPFGTGYRLASLR